MMAVVDEHLSVNERQSLFSSVSNGKTIAPRYDNCSPVLSRGATDILEQNPDRVIEVINRGHLPSGSIVFQTVLKQMVEEQIKTNNSENGGNENGSKKQTQKPNFRRCHSEKSEMLTTPRRQVRWANSERLLSPLPPHNTLHTHHHHHVHHHVHSNTSARVKRSISEGPTH